jgi:hypothetical protein
MKEEILAAIQAISEKIRQLETAKQALEELLDSGPWTRTKKPALAEERETWATVDWPGPRWRGQSTRSPFPGRPLQPDPANNSFRASGQKAPGARLIHGPPPRSE